MSNQARALLIGMLGPALQAVGVGWDLLEHGVFERGGLSDLTLEHIFSGPAHLVMFTGFMVSIVCIPIALRVAVAGPEDVPKQRQEPEAGTPLDATVEGAAAESWQRSTTRG